LNKFRIGSRTIYCVYTNYETDYTGPYTTVIGCKVKSLDQIPKGLTGITIPAGIYQENILTGKFPEKVHDAWQQIWSSNINRAHTADYDLYAAGAKSFEETEVKIYLAVK
jgi:predicted transcriptional regulator YdeE